MTTKIKAAQRSNERFVLGEIRAAAREGRAWSSLVLRVAIYNAIDRLKARGVIRYSTARHGYVMRGGR